MQTDSQQVTTTLLLEQLKDGENQQAWRQFDERFRPVVFAAARRIGLNEADSADIAQETIFQSLRDYRDGKYDRSRGRLSSWIVAIAHHRIVDVLRKKQRAGVVGGDTRLGELPAMEEVSHAWTSAMKDDVFRRAWEMVQAESQISPSNLRAFELAVLRGVPVAATAEECGTSADQVYVAKNRVSAKLREIVERLTRAFEDGL